jgi:hypothetical protein
MWLRVAQTHQVTLLAAPLMRYRCGKERHGYRYSRARTARAEYLFVLDRWLANDAVKDNLTGADLRCKMELERFDKIECAARALLLDHASLAQELLRDARKLRATGVSGASLKYSVLAYATAAARWPGISRIGKSAIAHALATRGAW